MFKQLGLIGCGLMGGSFALALRHGGLVRRVVGYSPSESSRSKASALGVIDSAVDSAAQAVAGADIVLVAVPVGQIETVFKAIRDHIEPGCLVMDVGSTKRDVVDTARRVLRERLPCFVPAHPIAGKELAGVEHAEATLYLNQQLILTPLPQTDPALRQKAEHVWTAIGARVTQMSPETHDETYAAVSHLPHLLAFAFFNSILSQPSSQELLAAAGPGFRDFTRIAASDPTMWRDVLSTNREELLKQSARFRHALDLLEHVIRNNDKDAIEGLVRSASDARAHWKMSGHRPKISL